MANEVTDVAAEITGDVNERIVRDAMEALHPTTTDQSKVEAPVEEVKAEAAETATTETKPETDVKDGEEPDKAPEVIKSESSTKLMYTPEEVGRLLADENAKADTSRMSPEVQLYYREMQRGTTKTFQKLADEKRQLHDDIAKREKAWRDKEIAEEEKRLRAEEELLDPEHARDRQEKRQIMREKDDQNQRITQLEQIIEAEKRQKIAEQNARDWGAAMVENNIPNDPEVEPILQDLAYAYTWAQNVGAMQKGQPGIGLSDGAKVISDLVGNEKNLRKFINANPKFREALEKEIIADHLKRQSAGPTTIRSTSGSVKERDKSDERPTREQLNDPDFDYNKKINDDALEMLRKIKT
jgi:hypothetical protein